MINKLQYFIFFVWFTSLSHPFQTVAGKPKSTTIETVTFKNNTYFSDKRLYRLMVSRPSTLFNTSKYHPEIFQQDLKNLILFYKQNGYLEASIEEYQVNIDTSSNKVHIIIRLKEGELTRIQAISFLANNIFSDNQLLKIINLNTGDPFSRKKIEDATMNLLHFYADRGYLETDINPEFRIDSVKNQAILDFRIKEGLQYRAGEIILHDLEKTKPSIIYRELKFKSGEVLNYSLLLKSQRELYLTGLFESVFIHPISTENEDTTLKDIKIDIKENPSIEFNTSFGYGSEEKLRGKLEIYNQNIGGKARKAGITLKWSSVKRGLEILFTEPWTFSTPWRSDLSLGTEYIDEPGYNLNQYGGRLTVGRVYHNQLNFTMRLRIQQGELSKVKVKKIPDDLKTNIRSLEISLIHDSRDNMFSTRSGVYADLSCEFGGTFSQNVYGFYRFITNLKYFYTRKSQTVFATGMEMGIMNAKGGLPNIPLSERFYGGGANSVRGFNYQKLGPVDENQTPLGGQFKWIWHVVEIRKQLYKMFYGVVFLDMGNIWSRAINFNFNDLRFTPGCGLRLDTPIGVGRIDLGINPDSKASEPQFVWSFSMGQAF